MPAFNTPVRGVPIRILEWFGYLTVKRLYDTIVCI